MPPKTLVFKSLLIERRGVTQGSEKNQIFKIFLSVKFVLFLHETTSLKNFKGSCKKERTGVTNYFGGYALTGGQGGLAPWLMLGGGVGAGIGGLSGYNQWNTNKTEYDDILKQQKACDAGLAAGTPVGMQEDGTPVTREDLDTGKVRVVRASEEGAFVFERVGKSNFDKDTPTAELKNGLSVDTEGHFWDANGNRAPAPTDQPAQHVANTTPFVNTPVGTLGGTAADGSLRYVGYYKPNSSLENLAGLVYHKYWVHDAGHDNGGYAIFAVPRNGQHNLTNSPEDYVWYRENPSANAPTPINLEDVYDYVQATDIQGGIHLFDNKPVTRRRNRAHRTQQEFNTHWFFQNERGPYNAYTQ